MTEQVDNLAQSLTNVAVNSSNNDPSDYVPTDDEDMAVHSGVDTDDDKVGIHVETISRDKAHSLLYDTDNDMDSSDPTGTAAIGQGRTFYYADQNIMDDPIHVANLPPALPAVIVAESQPGSGTSSQNQSLTETSSQPESETSSQNPTN